MHFVCPRLMVLAETLWGEGKQVYIQYKFYSSENKTLPPCMMEVVLCN